MWRQILRSLLYYIYLSAEVSVINFYWYIY